MLPRLHSAWTCPRHFPSGCSSGLRSHFFWEVLSPQPSWDWVRDLSLCHSNLLHSSTEPHSWNLSLLRLSNHWRVFFSNVYLLTQCQAYGKPQINTLEWIHGPSLVFTKENTHCFYEEETGLKIKLICNYCHPFHCETPCTLCSPRKFKKSISVPHLSRRIKLFPPIRGIWSRKCRHGTRWTALLSLLCSL